MSPTLLVGTDGGLVALSEGGTRTVLGDPVSAIAAGDGALWAIANGSRILRSEDGESWEAVAALEQHDPTCLLPADGGLLVGSSEAHLYRLSDSAPEQVDGFERIEGRDQWYTPWGGPPATRSLSRDASGALYANVHVGGIPKSEDGGGSWTPTLEVRADAHEVRAVPERPGRVLSATAMGLAESRDGGETWAFRAEGLRSSYSRAVAVLGETLFLTASDGPWGGHAAVYRRPLDSEEPLERCREGLPEWFEDNIDSGCLDAAAEGVAFGTAAGEVYASTDGGASWAAVATGLGPVSCLLAH